MQTIARISVILLCLALLACVRSTDNAGFLFRGPDPSRTAVWMRLGERDLRISLRPEVGWVIDHPGSVVWVGFSRNAKRFTTLACSGDQDYPTTILRLEQPDTWHRSWDQSERDFAEADADLISSIRHAFNLPAERTESDIIHWFCEGYGAEELRKRGAWPSGPIDFVVLPDRADNGGKGN